MLCCHDWNGFYGYDLRYCMYDACGRLNLLNRVTNLVCHIRTKDPCRNSCDRPKPSHFHSGMLNTVIDIRAVLLLVEVWNGLSLGSKLQHVVHMTVLEVHVGWYNNSAQQIIKSNSPILPGRSPWIKILKLKQGKRPRVAVWKPKRLHKKSRGSINKHSLSCNLLSTLHAIVLHCSNLQTKQD